MERDAASPQHLLKRKLIIDTDAGTDDAQAILMALSSPDVEVVALTTTHGNTTALQSALNVLRILKVVDRLDIPVYKGAEKALLGDQINSTHYHGNDGFGDAPDPSAPSEDFIQTEHGVDALIRIVKQHPGEITLVAIGPLTNVALALRLDPTFTQNLQDCFIMGGNYKAEGNITSNTEFNFAADPEAAKVVLDGMCSPITLVTWEVSWESRLSWDFYKETRDQGSKKAKFLLHIEDQIKRHNNHHGWEWILCDEIIMSLVLDPEVCQEAQLVYMTVECQGTLTRGQCVVDWGGYLGKSPNVKLVTKLNTKKHCEKVKLASS